ncbi:MAG TPA: hypothetical protein PLK31_10340 [Chloroflexota bacterium]|nr:hypothetical protein [Chloroflexota bacterium]
MSDYLRTTRESTVEARHPVLAAGIRAHIEKYELGYVAASALACCETTATRQKKGLFGRKTEVVLTAVLVTPTWLIWAAGKENEPPGVLSARLCDIQVQDYEKTPFYQRIPDSGLNITGLYTGAASPGSSLIGLG